MIAIVSWMQISGDATLSHEPPLLSQNIKNILPYQKTAQSPSHHPVVWNRAHGWTAVERREKPSSTLKTLSEGENPRRVPVTYI